MQLVVSDQINYGEEKWTGIILKKKRKDFAEFGHGGEEQKEVPPIGQIRATNINRYNQEA